MPGCIGPVVLPAPGLSPIIRAHHHRLLILKTALPDEGGEARLNTGAMGDKGGHHVVKICRTMGPERLVRHAARDGRTIDDRQKPDNPSGSIICCTGREFSTHAITFFARRVYDPVYPQDGAPRKESTETVALASLRVPYVQRTSGAWRSARLALSGGGRWRRWRTRKTHGAP